VCLWCAALFFVFTMRCFCNKSVRFCAMNEFPGFFFLAAVSQKLPRCSLLPRPCEGAIFSTTSLHR